ncbi:FkbM family methyltransferase [Jiangella anatolica]|uniref:FkbM family methyltransferase n=1 Tax=Jiangella anatolica TaxID=2670374 RepID=A0A2W2BJQ7_9ACTN|nr:FkbM family methyltransferase [Jiangella anatolica]PZF85500.1 FkbM family methyltransferase [Jiangella anatolica]
MATLIEHKTRNVLRRLGMEVVPTRRQREVSLLSLHLSRLFALLDVNVVLDVGARHGEYATQLRRNGYRGWIVSFEPVKESREVLTGVARADPKWRVLPVALGASDTTARINVARNTSLSSLRSASEYGQRDFGDVIETARIEHVQVRRLETMWERALEGIDDRRIYLKLDTQGWDLEVLDGAGDRLADVLALQTEASVQPIYDGMPTHLETLRAIEAAGFTVSGMFPVTLDPRLALVEYDCVAVRR